VTSSPARALALIFAVALVVRLGYTLAMYLIGGPAGLMMEDSGLYLALGDSFFRHADFVHESATGIEPETERMPLYIVWLALHRAIAGTGDPLFPALTQGALDALACLVIARLAGLFDARLVLPAGIVAALNPTQIVMSALILNDSVFYLFCCLALFAALAWLKAPAWRPALLLGLALGAAVSTRTMLLPWTALLALALPSLALLTERRTSGRWRRFLHHGAQMAVVVALCLAIQAPVFARNLSQYGSIYLTSQGGTHSLLWLAPLVRETIDGTPHEASAAEYSRRYAARHPVRPANPFEQSRQMDALAREVLGELGAGALIEAWVIGAAINLFSPAPILSPPVRALPRTGFLAMPGETKLAKMRAFLFANDNPSYGWILVLSGLGAILFRLVELVGIGLGLRARGRPPAERRYWRIGWALLLAWAGYILMVNGPVASAKYRLPIEPLAALGLALVLVALIERWRQRSRTTGAGSAAAL
jgi:hypothetical protein